MDGVFVYDKFMIWELIRIKKLSWQDVFNIWREGEENLRHWKIFWEEKGFNSWESWRSSTIEKLELEERDWVLYKIKKPLKTIPKFKGGPYTSWKDSYYKNGKFSSFKELAKHPYIQNHKDINKIKNNFPKEAYFIGVKTEQGILIIEGMHRCCALAIASQKGEKIESQVYIVLAQASAKEFWNIMESKD